MSFYKPEGTIGSGMNGSVVASSIEEAQEIHSIKRQEGLCAKIEDRDADQITVSWWV